MPSPDFIELEKAVAEAKCAITQENQRHAEQLGALQATLNAAVQKASIANAGVNLDAVLVAEQVLYVRGDASKVVPNDEGRYPTSRKQSVEDAIAWFDSSDARPDLRTAYVGVKNYSGFGDQRCDADYGYGPRHGHVVFEIGLRPDARKRDLTTEERNACIYYLRNIARIQAAKAEAA